MNMRIARGLALLLVGATVAPSAAVAQSLAFTPVTVIDVREGVARSDMTVIVTGNRIAQVGSVDEVDVPGGATIIDGTGQYLIPGLWDMHGHTGSDRDTREVIYPLSVAHGVTGIRNMGADCFDCADSIERVHARRRAVAAGELIGPRVVASSDYAGSHEQAANRSTEGSSPQAPATEADARAFVRLVKERGVDFIKVYDMLPREAYLALAEEANRLGLPFVGHVPVEVRASEASDAGQRSIEHVRWVGILNECSSSEDELRARLITELYKAEMGSRHTSDGPAILPLMLEMVDTHDPGKCAALAERFVRNDTWVVPNLMTARLPSELGSGWREDPYARFLTPGERRWFAGAEEMYPLDIGDAAQQAPVSRWARDATRAMHRAGVPMLAGSDAGETGIFWGIGLHQELELLVDAGLAEAEALRSATLGPAEFLEATDSLGTVEPGKVADLVLLDANPLEDIRNTQRIRAVVLNGRYLDREALDAMLDDAESAANVPLQSEPSSGIEDVDHETLPQQAPLAFTHVNVIDVEDGRILSDHTVLIRGERIAEVGPTGTVAVPPDAQAVDATGRYLIPGLWDMHVHSGGDTLGRTIDLPLYVAHGVTGVRELSGKPGHLQQRDEIARGELLGPRMVVGSPLVDGPNPFPVGEHVGQVRAAPC